jgi:Ca2+-binding RTX toxin-like protein
MRAVFAHPLLRLGFDPMTVWLAGTDDGIVISTGWAGDPPGTHQAGPAIALATITSSVITSPAAIAGGTFQRVENTKAWNTFKNISVTEAGLDSGAGGRLFIGNFVDVRIDLSAAGGGVDILVIGAKRGVIRTAEGDWADSITLVSHSNEGLWSNLMVIETFGGNDRIDITTVALSQLDDVMLADNGLGASGNGPLWNAAYDGRFSRYIIDAGDGDDIVTIRGFGSAVVFGGAGDDVLRGGGGDDWLDGGAGTDVLVGGGGNDTFVLRFGEIDDDVISDFSREGAGGRDTILFLGFSEEVMLILIDIAAGLYGIADGPGNDLALFLVQGLGGVPLGEGDYLFA